MTGESIPGESIHSGGTLGGLVVRACRRHRTRRALVGPDRTLTYSELAARIAGMTRRLREAGLSRGHGVAILAANSVDVVVATCAAMVAGLRLSPLSPLGSHGDHAFCIEDAGIKALIVGAAFIERGRALQRDVDGLAHLFTLGAAEGAIDLSAAGDDGVGFPVVEGSANDIAMIAYTGGTTGRPKGVVHSHRSMLAALHMAAAEWEWPVNGQVLAVTPVSHAAGILAYPTFMRGGALHVLSGFSPNAFYTYVGKERVGATFMAPTMIYRLLESPPGPDADLSSLETVFYGAAPMSPPRLMQAISMFGPIFMQLYGQTEAPTCISILRRAEHVLDDAEALASVGVPQAGLDISLRRADGSEAACDEAGEICVRGAFVMDGYWRRPDETERVFAGGWLHTGDVGRFDAQGRLHIVDRLKDMIISGGFNIYPREVEDAIATLEGVAACAVVGVPDPDWGEAVAVVIAPAPGLPEVDVAAVKAHVRDVKGATHVPKHMLIVDSLPLTPIGKVDKKAVRELFARQS